MRSKLLSVILSICMVLTLTPAMAFAAGGDTDVSPQVEATTGGAIVVGSTGEGYSVAEAKANGNQLSAAITVTKADLTSAKIVVTTTTTGINDAEVTGTGTELTKGSVTTGSALTQSEQDKGVTAKVEITVDWSSTTSESIKGTLKFAGTPNSETYNVTVTITKDGGEEPGPDPEEPGTTTGGAITTEPAISVDKNGTTEQNNAAEAAQDALAESGVTVPEADQAKIQDVLKEETKDMPEATQAQETAVKALPALDGDSSAVVPVAQAFVDVKLAAKDIVCNDSGVPTSITYNLEYKYEVYYTTVNQKNSDGFVAENGVNAIKSSEPAKVLNITVPVKVEFAIADNFAAILGSTPWVNHKGMYAYKGAIDAGKLSFTTKNGFSPFTVTAEDPSVAQIGTGDGADYYVTLQAAVDAVADNGTITILKELTGDDAKATPSERKNIKFALGQNVPPVTLTIGNNTVEVNENGGSYTPPSTGGGGGGGGSSATTYTVTVPSSIDHGKITVSPKSASKGKTVTITATPDEGYKVGTITVKDKDGNEIEVKDAGDGKYTFVMPASKVEISATFVEDDGTPTDPTDPTTPGAVTYSDVAETAWYYDAVNYVTTNGLMNGVGNDRFAPNSNLTRAMFAQILYNKEGKPAAGASTFSDVAAGQWYTDAISWAAANGVVNGIGNNMFGPNNNITREQLAVMLYRYAGSPAVTGSVTGFNDAGQISSYATTAMAWATTNGVMNGKGDGRLDPKGLATRAEVAQMMQNYFK